MNKRLLTCLGSTFFGATFMAFAKGAASKEAPEFKNYTGLVSATLLAVNPTLDELKKIYPNREKIEEPVYVSTKEDKDGSTIQKVNIKFYLKTEETESAPSMIVVANYSLLKKYMFNQEKTKVKVIDEYGRTSWVTKEEFDKQAIPVSAKTGNPLNITSPYRKTYVGEEQLIGFLKAFMCISDPMTAEKQEDGTYKWYYKPDEELVECKADFSEVENFFKGNINEIKDIISYQKDNKIQILVGVRTYDGKMSQQVFTEYILWNSSRSTKQLEKALEENQNRYQDTVFIIQPIQEYKVEASNLNNTGEANAPQPSEMPSW